MQLQIDDQKKEIKEHGSYHFPLLISHESLSDFDTKSFLCHWHPEIELTLVQEGDIAYQTNETVHYLQAGEGLFCNANVLHAGQRHSSENCRYLSVTFHPRLISSFPSSLIQTEYVTPVLENKTLAAIHFRPDGDWQSRVLALIHEMDRGNTPLRQNIILLCIWEEITTHTSSANDYNERCDTARIKSAIEYIAAHYSEQITLDQLAAEMNLCKSESCRAFKKYMGETFFTYLNRYRIGQSLYLLKDASRSITEVAGLSGFVSLGYFTKRFKEITGITPREYRKKQKSRLNRSGEITQG